LRIILRAVPGCYRFFEVSVFTGQVFTYSCELAVNEECLYAGMSAGTVTAGVVGARKPQYDIWGSCVNVARSLQRTSLPNCIHVNSQFTYVDRIHRVVLHVSVFLAILSPRGVIVTNVLLCIFVAETKHLNSNTSS